jgi:hypothetical protein
VQQPSMALPLVELREGQCKFPTHEELGLHLFCGHPAERGDVYCPAHCALAYNSGARR